MDIYDSVSYSLSKSLTNKYSTSFSLSSRLFSKETRKHIFAIYGLVRIADEVVDTYKDKNADRILNELESQTKQAIELAYSTNPIIHSFALTVRKFDIPQNLITSFFESMRMDLSPLRYNDALYKKYIYGSAEVVGLMCLGVFCEANQTQIKELAIGAKSLGSAFQKVNFLRDLRSDFEQRNRIYFPDLEIESFSNDKKQEIIEDIYRDFDKASQFISKLPKTSKYAVNLSYLYYKALLKTLKDRSSNDIFEKRYSLSKVLKAYLYVREYIRKLFKL